MTIHRNMAEFRAAEKALREHPMSARVLDEGDVITVIYPEGDFPVGGVRCPRSASGMRRAVDIMETHWRQSFP